MIWFGFMSDISQLASRVGDDGEWGTKVSISLPSSGRETGRGVVFPPLG